MENPVFNPLIPFIGPVSDGRFTHQKMARIQGDVPALAYRFNINLQCGSKTHPQNDIALQISVKLVDGYVSLNSLENGIWGEEQRGILPIQCHQNFEIIIMCDFNEYKIAINGIRYFDFPQRIHCDRITHLAVEGDVIISQISYESLPPEGAASAPLPTPPPNDDFEIVDSSRDSSNTPLLRNQPPAYDTIAINQPPYPTPSVSPYHQRHPAQPPYPTSSVPGAPCVSPQHQGVPTESHVLPYPAHSTPGLGVQPPPGIHPPPPSPGIHAPPPAIGIHSPPHDTTIALNASSYGFRPVEKKSITVKCVLYSLAIILGIIVIIAIIVAKVLRNREIHNQS